MLPNLKERKRNGKENQEKAMVYLPRTIDFKIEQHVDNTPGQLHTRSVSVTIAEAQEKCTKLRWLVGRNIG